jgi:membrane-associated phospholipid phosphatase
MLSGGETRQRISRDLFRDNLWDLLIMAALFGIPPFLVLYYLDGPETLLAIVVAVSVTMLSIALTNLVYRASFHLAMVTSMLAALWLPFGIYSLAALPLLPVLGISRYQLGEHSPAQIVAGFFIGLAVSTAVFFGLGLIG